MAILSLYMENEIQRIKVFSRLKKGSLVRNGDFVGFKFILF